MSGIPPHVEKILENALVCAFTCLDYRNRPVTHPLLPLYDKKTGKLYFTSSILFSKKLEYIKNNPKVAALFSNRKHIPNIGDDEFHVVLVKGDATVDESDIHHGWERLVPLWQRKEPYITAFIKQRIALPLFWERAVIELTPRKIYVWEHGYMSKDPTIYEVG